MGSVELATLILVATQFALGCCDSCYRACVEEDPRTAITRMEKKLDQVLKVQLSAPLPWNMT